MYFALNSIPSPMAMDPVSVTTAPNAAFSYPESVESSPRSRGGVGAESFDDHFPSKLRLMCSYGGRIVPRPTDKSLCYLGGDTRIVSVDRHSSLADLHSKLSRSLLNNTSFILKYQLPNEDLDSLVSVTTDEDLENMIEEYDRIVNSGSSNGSGSTKSSRIRLFLFLNKSDSSAPSSIGSLLDDSKSETWFVDALNGAMIDSRGSTDSATVNCLLGLEDDSSVNSKSEVGLPNNTVNPNTTNNNNNSNNVVGAGGEDVDRVLLCSPDSSGEKLGKQQEMNSIPNSPMFEKNSSFGSASSVPSLSSLPHIRIREDGQPHEDQFQQPMNLNHAPQPNATQAPAIFPTVIMPAMSPTVVMPAVSTTENPNLNRFLLSDDGNLDSLKQVNQSPKLLVPIEAAAPVTDLRTGHYQEQNRTSLHLEPKQPIQVSELPPPYRIQQVPMPVLDQNFINPTLNAQEQLHLHQQIYPQQQQHQQQYIHTNQQQFVQFPSYYQVPHHQIQQQPQQFDPNLPIYYIPFHQNTQPLSGVQTPQPKVVHPKPDIQQNMYQTANNPVPGGYVQGMGYHVMHHHQHPSSQAQSFVYTNAGSGMDNTVQQAQTQVYYTHNACMEADVNQNRAS